MEFSFTASVEALHSMGLRVNNLFELGNGLWQANVTDGTLFWEFARAASAEEALARALAIARTRKGEPSEVLDLSGTSMEWKSRTRAVSESSKTTSTTASAEDLGL